MKCPSCGVDFELQIVKKGEANWRKEPASPAQLRELKRLEIQHNPNLTKGQASDLLDFHKHEKRG